MPWMLVKMTSPYFFPGGCRIESPVFVEEVTAPRERRHHDHRR
jgi:hypothetical protein